MDKSLQRLRFVRDQVQHRTGNNTSQQHGKLSLPPPAYIPIEDDEGKMIKFGGNSTLG